MIYVEIVTACTPADHLPGRSVKLGCFVIHSTTHHPAHIGKTTSAFLAVHLARKVAAKRNEKIMFWSGRFEDMRIEVLDPKLDCVICPPDASTQELRKEVRITSGRVSRKG